MPSPLITIEHWRPEDSRWNAEISAILQEFGAPANPLMFPNHFLQATYPKIGGQAFCVRRAGERIACILLFPRGLSGARRVYTARFYARTEAVGVELRDVVARVRRSYPDADLVAYDPSAPQAYQASAIPATAGIEIGRPDATEARAARRLQQAIWKSSEKDLYPSDLYSQAFRAATALVARAGPRVAGFLFGFYKFAAPPLPSIWRRHEGQVRIESQVAGVDRELQGRGIGFLLKKTQAEEALREGIGVINWTVDPLQKPNAQLNFGKLRAVSCRFYPNHYAFTNEKNQTPASRLEMTWLPATMRVQRALANERRRSVVLDLANDKSIAFLNDGFRPLAPPLEPPDRFAIEIPDDWTTLQDEDIKAALKWRSTTDALLAAYLGPDEGRYMIADLGRLGARWYLVAYRIGTAFREEAFT